MKKTKQAKKTTKQQAAPVVAPVVAPVTTNAAPDKSAQGTVKVEATRTIVLGDGRQVEVPTGNAPAPVAPPPCYHSGAQHGGHVSHDGPDLEFQVCRGTPCDY